MARTWCECGSWPDRRVQEYLPGVNRRRFDAHLRFVTGEVIPWAGGQFGPVEGPWVAAGFSNGDAWAIAAAQRRPDLLTAVAAFSSGVVPQRISREARSARIRHYLAAGTLEPGSGGLPGSGRSGCKEPGSPAATGNGSAATTTCGGSSNSPSRSAGCCRYPEHP
jgi:hypothetical protein